MLWMQVASALEGLRKHILFITYLPLKNGNRFIINFLYKQQFSPTLSVTAFI